MQEERICRSCLLLVPCTLIGNVLSIVWAYHVRLLLDLLCCVKASTFGEIWIIHRFLNKATLTASSDFKFLVALSIRFVKEIQILSHLILVSVKFVNINVWFFKVIHVIKVILLLLLSWYLTLPLSSLNLKVVIVCWKSRLMQSFSLLDRDDLFDNLDFLMYGRFNDNVRSSTSRRQISHWCASILAQIFIVGCFNRLAVRTDWAPHHTFWWAMNVFIIASPGSTASSASRTLSTGNMYNILINIFQELVFLVTRHLSYSLGTLSCISEFFILFQTAKIDLLRSLLWDSMFKHNIFDDVVLRCLS